MGRIVKLQPRGQITIPIEFRQKLGLEADALLSLSLEENRIQITPVAVVEKGEELREYSEAEVAEFLREDRIDPETAEAVARLLGLARA